MVVTLRQLISEVRAAPTLEDAMAVIIQQVKKAIRIDACAVSESLFAFEGTSR